MNTDQGPQFTSFAWTDRLRRSGVRISMDGRGRFLDNIFVERLWRSLKYECVYLHAWETGSDARAGITKWVEFYNHKRPHSAHVVEKLFLRTALMGMLWAARVALMSSRGRLDAVWRVYNCKALPSPGGWLRVINPEIAPATKCLNLCLIHSA